MSAQDASTARGGTAAERIVAAVLLVIALLLGYVRFVVLRTSAVTSPAPFDFRNPMLDAREGECHEIEDSSEVGVVTCESVAAPGVVLRPAVGPEELGTDYDGLRRMPPYLVCQLRYPESGRGCAGLEDRKPAPYQLFGLNHFGLPLRISGEVMQIQPHTKTWQGRVHRTYQVQMLRHGAQHGPWTVWLSDEAPVTGAVYREYQRGETRTQHVVFREVEGCTPPR
jgi:hypothetical protein